MASIIGLISQLAVVTCVPVQTYFVSVKRIWRQIVFYCHTSFHHISRDCCHCVCVTQ